MYLEEYDIFYQSMRGVFHISKDMKSTGIIRKIDELGRVVIPIELRTNLGIKVKDSIEIYVDNQNIILKKHEPNCIFCGSSKNTSNILNKLICRSCLEKLKNS